MTTTDTGNATQISHENAIQQTRQGRPENEETKQSPVLNVPAAERWGSGLAGGALLYTGLRMRTLPGAFLAFVGGAMLHRAVTGHCMAYSALGINRAKGEGATPEEYFQQGIHVSESTTINKPAEELYQYWRDFKNLPHIMSYLESVEVIDHRKSKWRAKAPAGLTVQWEAEIISDTPGKKIAWRSLYPASVDNAGSVRFLSCARRSGY